MMDLIMIAVLAGSVGLIYLLIGWCQEAGRPERVRRSEAMIVLGVVVVFLGCYLVYALVHPENF